MKKPTMKLMLLFLIASAISPGTQAWANKSLNKEGTDKNPTTLFGYLSNKKAPSTINIDFHMRSAFHGKFRTDDENKASFKADQLMLGIYGHITDKLSYNYRHRLNYHGKAFSTENLNNSIDYAYIRYDFDEKFGIVAGRHAVLVGGFEYQQYPIEVYDYSGISNNLTSYLTGLSLYYKPSAHQEFIAQVVNNRTGSMEESYGALSADIQKPTAPLHYGLGWNSEYFKGKLQLRYAAVAGELADKKWLLMLSGGQKLNLGKVDIFLDVFYHRSDIDHLGIIRRMRFIDEVVKKVEYFTVSSELNYRFKSRWNLRMKAFHDRAYVTKDKTLKKGNYLTAWTYQAGAEFYPFADNNLHIFFNGTAKTYGSTSMGYNSNTRSNFRISAGFVYRLPVL
ncbi:MAG: porin [Bacteroides sp.]